MERLRELWHAFGDSLRTLLHWVEGLAEGPYGSLALFAIAFAESSVFPIPPDVLLIALCLGRPELALWFAALCTVGSVLGGLFGYGIGYWGGRPVLARLFAPERVARVADLYDRFNAWATGIAGLTPLPYKIFTVSGGAFAVNLRIFVLASVLGRGLRFFAVAGLIHFWGDAAKRFIDQYLNVLTVGFVVLLVLGFLVLGRWSRRATAEATDE